MAARGVDLSKFDFHVRTKQDDHLTEGKRVNRILLQGIQGEDKGFLNKYSNICDLAIYSWHMQSWHKNKNGFIGFTDLSFKGNIVHDTINLVTGDNGNPKNEENLWDLLNSPLRLNNSNVDQHFEYLNQYIEPVYIHEEIASQIIGLEKTIQRLKIKIETIVLHAKERKIIRDILKELISKKGTGLKTTITVHHSSIEEVFANQNVVEELRHCLRNLGKRYGKRNDVATASCAFEFFKRLDSEITVEVDGVITRVSLPMEEKYSDLLRALVKELNKEIVEYRHKTNTEKATLAQLQKEDEQINKHVHGISVHEIDLSVTKPTLFPLKDNMVFCHAIQLSFDSDISDFIVEAQEIEDSNLPLEHKRRHLVQAMEQVLPIIKTYIQILMGATNQALPPHFNKKAYQSILR
jgi:hypothetical protein